MKSKADVIGFKDTWDGTYYKFDPQNGATPPPNLLPGTNREATPLNWILYIVFFGWIWMRWF
ncbi:MAG: hypothetical protein FWE98_07455 [Oscillospiraceae bacterium]|nr:hypothetical protein [Oscillospiraceae bacterium]